MKLGKGLLLCFCFLFPGFPCAVRSQEVVKLLFTGDIMAHEKNQSMRDYSDIYAGVLPWLKTADFAFANLETPLEKSRPVSDYPSFNARPAYAEAAVKAGFNVFSLANNHANDFGADSVDGTLKTMDELKSRYPITFSGLKRKPDDGFKLEILEKNGWKIGFIALTNLLNSIEGAKRVNWLRYWDVWEDKEFEEQEKLLVDSVRIWRPQVDLLVLGIHDGIEYAQQPAKAQIRFYTRLVDAGVDILWAQHPHVVLPWSRLTTERGDAVILFSMGNFISRQIGGLRPSDADSRQARTGDGLLFIATWTKSLHRISLTSLDLQPINNFDDPEKGMVVLPTSQLADSGPPAWRAYYKKRLQIQQTWSEPLVLQ